jgi:murein DD-endopeptidase MepM/ murein hydrolase activator NlpD
MSIAKYPILSGVIEENKTIDLSETTDRAFVRELQTLLNSKGFDAGEADGIAGPKTLAALERAKDRLSLQYPELVGRTTLDRLFHLVPVRSFFLPTDGVGRITSRYGYRVHPVTGRQRLHRGIDIGADRGTPVHAVDNGIVSLAVSACTEGNGACGGGFGNHVRLTHLQNAAFNETVYAHLQTVTVRHGQTVSAGQVIGTLGNTGRSTGPHLHFETWRGGRAFDPEDIMKVV